MAPRNRAEEVLFVESDRAQPFRYAVGREGSRFFRELKQGRFFGLRCGGCRRVYVPPRRVCGPCWRTMADWVEVGPAGTLETYTILRFPFIDPETGEKKPVPYGYGFIRLDGAGTSFQHFLALPEQGELRIGDRVRPVFEEDRRGTLRDIRWFKKEG